MNQSDVSQFFLQCLHPVSDPPAGDDERRIEGRCSVLGVGIGPNNRYETVSGASEYIVRGTIRLYGLNDGLDGNDGNLIIEFPVIAQAYYPVSSFCSFGDGDGYVLFPNGLWVEDDGESGGDLVNPLQVYALYIFYVGNTGVS